jgi:hypothetical protein
MKQIRGDKAVSYMINLADTPQPFRRIISQDSISQDDISQENNECN